MPAKPASSESIPLEYAPRPRRSRKIIIRSTLGLILLAISFCGWRWGPYTWRQSQLLYWQRKCLNYSAPAEKVVYEEEPAAAAQLLKDPSYSPYVLKRGARLNPGAIPVHAAAFDPFCWRRLRPLSTLSTGFFGTGGWAVIFLHERISPAGHHRLVCLEYAPDSDTFQPAFIEDYDYDGHVAPLATWTKPLIDVQHGRDLDVMSGWPRHPPLVRLFAGQPDPNDSSHFTIRYQMWGQEDVLDGWLEDDDDVKLTPRHLPDWPRN